MIRLLDPLLELLVAKVLKDLIILKRVLRGSMRKFHLFLLLCVFPIMATSTLSAEKLSWKETLGSAVKAASANDNALAFNLFEKAFRACTTDVSRRDIIRKSLALRFCDAPKLSDVEQAAADVCIMNAKVAFLKKALAPYSIPAKLVILEKIKEWKEEESAINDIAVKLENWWMEVEPIFAEMGLV